MRNFLLNNTKCTICRKKIFDNLRNRPFFQANLLQQFNDAEHMNGSHYNPFSCSTRSSQKKMIVLRRQSGRSGWIDGHGMSWGFVPLFRARLMGFFDGLSSFHSLSFSDTHTHTRGPWGEQWSHWLIPIMCSSRHFGGCEPRWLLRKHSIKFPNS